MALKIVEFFGFEPLRAEAKPFIEARKCPFVDDDCIKPEHGACAVRQTTGGPIICCPNRLYAEHYSVLRDIALGVFGSGTEVIDVSEARRRRTLGAIVGNEAVLFGKRWGGELALPRPKKSDGSKSGSYYVDWIIAKLDNRGELREFTAVEVQTIDTTGTYRDQSDAYFSGKPFVGTKTGFSNAGMNWENVNKRILPQIIYKGHVLRLDAMCSKGLFFVCPAPVYHKIMDRLGDSLREYPIGNGTVTFQAFDLEPLGYSSGQHKLAFRKQFTTTVDRIALAFTSPANLPASDVYQVAIKSALA